MSIKLMTQVWELSLDASDKLVLLALADWSNDAGVCWPSIPTLARKCSASESTIKRAIRSLEAAGYLSRQMQSGTSSRYMVDPGQIDRGQIDRGQIDTPAKLTGEGGQNDPQYINDTSSSGAKAPSRSRERGSTIDVALKTREITADEATSWAVTELRWPRGEAKTEWQRFLDSNAAHGRRYKDWKAAWRNWCRSPFCEAAKRNDDKTSYRREPLRG